MLLTPACMQTMYSSKMALLVCPMILKTTIHVIKTCFNQPDCDHIMIIAPRIM